MVLWCVRAFKRNKLKTTRVYAVLCNKKLWDEDTTENKVDVSVAD
jgi:hypothetical protein